jgi:hypothetical protein
MKWKDIESDANSSWRNDKHLIDTNCHLFSVQVRYVLDWTPRSSFNCFAELISQNSFSSEFWCQSRFPANPFCFLTSKTLLDQTIILIIDIRVICWVIKCEQTMWSSVESPGLMNLHNHEKLHCETTFWFDDFIRMMVLFSFLLISFVVVAVLHGDEFCCPFIFDLSHLYIVLNIMDFLCV